MKWATFIYKNVLIPTFTLHHKYWVRKVAVDQYLEQRTLKFNVLVGVVFGLVAYLCTVPMRTFAVDRTLWQLRGDAIALQTLVMKHHGGVKGEMPFIVLGEAQAEIMSAIVAARDEAEVRKMESDVMKIKMEKA